MLKTYDLSEQTARVSSASVRKRIRRLRFRGFMIAQCAITAGLAWWLAGSLLEHPNPFFAPIAAIITLGFSFGQRLSRGVEIGFGAALGVLVGDLFVVAFGSGVWQVTVVIAIAMSLATLVGARNLMITQAGVQAAIVVTLLPMASQGVSRWLDAVIGVALALIVTTVAPSAPLVRPRLLAAAALSEVAATLESTLDAFATGDEDAAMVALQRATAAEHQLNELKSANDEGMAVVRYSPFAPKQRVPMQSIAALYNPLDRLTRNLRVLVRRVVIATYHLEVAPTTHRDILAELADIVRSMAHELYERRLPVSAQGRIVRLARHTSSIGLDGSLSSIVVLAQVRSMLADLLHLSGLSYSDARDLIPDID